MVEALFFLLSLVLSDEACLKDTRSDTHLELILFDLVVVEGHDGPAMAFLLLTIRAEVAYT